MCRGGGGGGWGVRGCVGEAEQKTHNETPVRGQVLETEQPDTLSWALWPQIRLGRMHPVSGPSVICKTFSFTSDLLKKIHSKVENRTFCFAYFSD